MQSSSTTAQIQLDRFMLPTTVTVLGDQLNVNVNETDTEM
jgi:hypothetical protein